MVVDEELRKSIADYFDAGDFAEFIGISTRQIVDAFPDELEDALDDVLELMGLRKDDLEEDNEEEEE